MRGAWPQTCSLSSACGASRRTLSQPGTAASTPWLRSLPCDPAASAACAAVAQQRGCQRHHLSQCLAGEGHERASELGHAAQGWAAPLEPCYVPGRACRAAQLGRPRGAGGQPTSRSGRGMPSMSGSLGATSASRSGISGVSVPSVDSVQCACDECAATAKACGSSGRLRVAL